MISQKTKYDFSALEKSDKATELGIINKIPKELQDNAKILLITIDEIEEVLGESIRITSGYRCEALNKAVGGAEKSDHKEACAVDFQVRGMTPKEVCGKLEKSKIKFYKLINEFDKWTHVSIIGRKIMTATKDNGKTVYKNGIA